MSGGELPSVSVVIPCYNYGHYLTECVQSVLHQVGVEVRVLIIDDASPDGSGAVAERLAASDPRVTARLHQVNRGHIRTYNEGLLEWADGDFVTLLSADDLLTPGSLARSTEILRRLPNVVMVYGRALEFESELTPVSAPRAGAVVWPGMRWLERRFNEAANVVPNPGVVLRTATQRAVGGYDPGLPHAGDLEMWLRAATVGDLAFVRGPAQAGYRVHGASMSQRVYRDRLADARERHRVFDSFLDAQGGRLPQAETWRQHAQRALAVEVLHKACRAYEKGQGDCVDMSELVTFLDEVYPRWSTLPAARALARRRKLGSDVCRKTGIFLGTAATWRAQDMLWWSRWRRRGG